MSKKDEALKEAIVALEESKELYGALEPLEKLLIKCKEALKPHPQCDEACMFLCANDKKEWQELDEEEICSIYTNETGFFIHEGIGSEIALLDFARAIEKELKEKNHGTT